MSEYGPPTPVPIFQHHKEFSDLLALYRSRSPKRVLEVGTYHGGTLYHWLQNAAKGATIVSLDTYTAADNRHLYEEWTRDDVKLHVIQGDSRTPKAIHKVAKHAPFNWIFIDADHEYESVKADWENYGKMASSSSVVCFHDILDNKSAHPEIDVQRLWRKIQEEYKTEEIINDTNAVWGGIGIAFIP